LHHARHIHGDLAARPSGKAGLFMGWNPGGKDEIRLHPISRVIAGDAEFFHGFDNIDTHHANIRIKALHVHCFRPIDIMLHAIDNDRKRTIEYIQVGINTHGSGKKYIPGFVVTIEKKPVVKIAVRTYIGDGFWCLVQRIVITFSQHSISSLLDIVFSLLQAGPGRANPQF
jgi:hypothetical protein